MRSSISWDTVVLTYFFSNFNIFVHFYYLRDRSTFMKIGDREICNGTTRYFVPSVGRGHLLFWELTLRGHRLFWCKISTGSKIILEHSDTGHWLHSDFTSLAHNKNTGPWQIYSTGPTTISDEGFNGAMENFWASRYGAMHYFVW